MIIENVDANIQVIIEKCNPEVSKSLFLFCAWLAQTLTVAEVRLRLRNARKTSFFLPFLSPCTNFAA